MAAPSRLTTCVCAEEKVNPTLTRLGAHQGTAPRHEGASYRFHSTLGRYPRPFAYVFPRIRAAKKGNRSMHATTEKRGGRPPKTARV